MPGTSILIIDDDPDVLDALKVLLEDEFSHIVTESNISRIAKLISVKYDIILLDMNFSAGINTGNEGLFWLSRIMEQNSRTAVVMMTAYGNIDLAVEAIKRGAKDFVLKPWDNQKLLATLKAIMLQQKTTIRTSPIINTQFVAGKSKPVIDLLEKVKKVASTSANILLLGENGVGKEMVAREIHRLSDRTHHQFHTVDLSVLSPNLFESELFGHKKGAFTDARSDRKGRFEEADGGTLFLDEIANLPLAEQVKLLTVLQNREIVPVGSNISIPINVRLITATNAPLQEFATQGVFRQDLLYRINTITLYVPPLRERGQDIISLAIHFIAMYSRNYAKENIRLSDEATHVLLTYPWPGNVRELQHTMEKAVILCNTNVIDVQDLNLSISSRQIKISTVKTLDEMEKEALLHALKNHEGNIVQAAKTLGITRQTFYNKMKKYGI